MFKKNISNLNIDSLLLTNISFTSLLFVSRLLIPFATYLYILRQYDDDTVGLLIFYQTINIFFNYFINFGFDVYLTKVVSETDKSQLSLNKLYLESFIIKLVLFLTILLTTLIFEFFGDNNWLLFVFVFANIKDVILPRWYFWGKENFRDVSLIEIFYYLIILIISLLFISKESNAILVPFSHFFSSLVIGFTVFIVLKNKKIDFNFSRYDLNIYKLFKESLPFFISRISAIITENGAKIFIGNFLGLAALFHFDIASKIISLAKAPNLILDSILYPRAVKLKNKKFLNKWIQIKIVLAIIISVICWFLAKDLVAIISGELNNETVKYVRWFLPVLVITSISYFIGGSVLVANNYEKIYNNSVNIGASISLIILTIFYFLNFNSLVFLIGLMLFIEFLVFIIRYVNCKKKNIL
jgi:PST family polysaccharide transporter